MILSVVISSIKLQHVAIKECVVIGEWVKSSLSTTVIGTEQVPPVVELLTVYMRVL